MDSSVEFIEFGMHCPSIELPPERTLPDGYTIRTFEPGDDSHWAAIEHQVGEFETAGQALARFDREFRPKSAMLPSRMFFLVHERDGPVGTATAWIGECFGRTMGRLHWVAIVPDHQGKGLARTLVHRAIARLGDDGSEAYLTTQTSSWRAVALYRSFGFVEINTCAETERAIAIVNAKIAEPNR